MSNKNFHFEFKKRTPKTKLNCINPKQSFKEYKKIINLKQRYKKNKKSTKKLRERERERTFFCEGKICKEWKRK